MRWHIYENIRPRGTSYSIKGVSSNGLSRGGHSVKSPDPYSVLISLSVIDLSIVVCVKSKTISLVVIAVQVVLGL